MALPVTITGISTAVAPVGPFKVPGALWYTTGATSGFSYGFGGGAAERISQSFTAPASGAVTVIYVQFRIGYSGTPADSVRVDIYATNGSGQPTGVSLGTSTTIAASTMVSSGANAVFTFSTPVSLTNSTQYAAVLSRTGSLDTSNFYTALFNNANVDAAQTLAAYASGTWTIDASARDLQFYVSGGPEVYYFFGRDSTTATTLRAYKSSAPDTSWSAISATPFAYTTAILNIAAYYVSGPVIYIVVQDGTASTALATKYTQFSLVTETYLTGETVSAAVAVTGQIAGAGAGASLVVRSNGNVVVFYSGVQTKTSGTFRARVYYRERTPPSILGQTGTWGTETQVDPIAATDNSTPFAILGAANRVHFAWTAGATTGYRTLSAANAMNTAGSNASMTAPGDGVSYDRSGTTKVVWTSNINAAQGTLRLDSSDNPTPTFANQSIAAATIPHRIGTFPNTDDVTIVYRSSADSDLYSIKSSDDGATFGAPVSFFVGTVANADANVSRNASGGVYARGGSTVVGYLVNDGGTLKFNEYALLTNRVLTADKGAFTLNGPVNKLAYGRAVNAAAGVFALAGTDAAMRRGYTLAAAPGAFALSGKAVACHLKRAATTGSFVLAGQVTVLRYARIFPAAKGSVVLAGPVTGVVAAKFVRATVTAYSLSGKDATLTWTSAVVHRTMPAATGALTVNGQAVALKRSYAVPHTAGAVVLGGVATSLRAIRTMPAVKGTLALTGQATGLRYGRVTVVTSGTFTLNGQVAGLKFGRVLTAVSGAFVLTGQAVVLGYGSAKTMLASTGAFVLTGQANKLAHGRKFAVTVGAFNLTGQAATLRSSVLIAAVRGTFTLNGFATGLGLGRKLLATTATTFALNGQPVTLRYTRKMVAAIGNIVLNGSVTNLIWSGSGAKTMPAAKGTLVLTGIPVSFRQTAAIRATVTSFTLTGSVTDLQAGRRLAAATGSIVLTGKSVTLSSSEQRLPAQTGAIMLAGTDANLVYHVIAQSVLTAAPAYLRLAWVNVSMFQTRHSSKPRPGFRDDYGWRDRMPPPSKFGRR